MSPSSTPYPFAAAPPSLDGALPSPTFNDQQCAIARQRLRQIAIAPWSEHLARLPEREQPLPAPPVELDRRLAPYLQPKTPLQWDPSGVAIAPAPVFSQGMLANAYFFGHPRWGRRYAQRAHRSTAFRDRWQAALNHSYPNGWNGRVVVDLGCGAGTLWERLGGEPAEMIGVDISLGALRWAQELGYAALRADVHHLPLQSGCAEVVVANGLLHHCDQVARVLSEAARLVKLGGVLITDLDPQYSAWQRQGWGLWLQQQQWLGLGSRLGAWLRGAETSPDEQAWQLATERHNRQPGQGLQPALFHSVLGPLGFDVAVYPHNGDVGAELLVGQWGRSPLKVRWEQRLSGLNPSAVSAASTLLCIAQRVHPPERNSPAQNSI